jgi:hypothetical protein
MKICVSSVSKFLALAALMSFAAAFPPQARAQAAGQKTFATSDEAVAAFIAAVRSNNVKELEAILGPESGQMISSGDPVADKNARDRYAAGYDAKHSLLETAPHQLTLTTGKDNYALPIPLVQANGKWYFDGAAGKEEILYRRIGRNELGAIDVCKGLSAAQKDYAATGHDGLPAGVYAQRIVSKKGQQDGLYYEVKEGEPASPAGDLIGQAADENYTLSPVRAPYHGYFFRILKAQGASATGGAKSYVVDGRMTGGFAFLAYPAEYRSSGVMTFIVNQRGVIYQKDLGEKTAEMAKEITEYSPDKSWTPVH